ncbi:MAG: PorT family protein [Prolixibacteraceae bacterium]|nr:PorT family protein [Prolixibacteraceae bacterium]
MKEKDKLFDEMLRKKLEEYSVEPPAHIWQNVKPGMVARKRNRKAVYLRWAAAATVVLVLGAGLFYAEQKLNRPVVADHHPVVVSPPKATQPVILDSEKAPEPEPAKTEIVQTADSGNGTTITEPTGKDMKKHIAQMPEKQDEEMTAPPFSHTQGKMFSFIHGKDALLPNEKMTAALQGRPQRIVAAYDELSEADKIIIAANIERQRQKMKFKNQDDEKWSVGMYVASAYASSSTSYKPDYLRSMSNTSGKTGTNTASGFSVRYGTSSKWKLESGFYYSSTSNGSQNRLDLKSASVMYRDVNSDYGSGSQNFFNSVLNIENGEATINGNAGVIKLSRIPQNSATVPQPEYMAMTSEFMLAEGEIIQQFNYVEVPLMARYALLSRRMGVELAGGISTNMLVGNHVYLNNSVGKERVGSVADLSFINFSGTAGLGFSFDLTQNLELSVEPRVSYNLNSLSKNDNISFKPWRAGLYAGVSYVF